jgi:hypothetical protein
VSITPESFSPFGNKTERVKFDKLDFSGHKESTGKGGEDAKT